MAKFTGATTLTSSSALSESSGNIGVSTPVPTVPLHVTRYAGSTGTMILEGNDTVVGMPSLTFKNNNGDATANISFNTSTQLVLNNTLYVGTSSVTASGDIVLSAANPFIYGGTAAGGVGISNVGGQTYIKVFGASHATLANVTQFVNASSTSLTIASSGAATFSSSITVATIAALTPSVFGYSSSYPTLIVGPTGNSIYKTLCFGVDVSGNPSGAFSGLGSEYVWRNTASFITPNSSNNGFNTLLSWNSSGQFTFNQAATFNSSVTASTYLGVSRDGSDTIGAGPYLVLSQTTNSRQWIQQMSASLSLNFYHYNGSAWIQPLTLGPTGNVGVGIASPEEPLHVYTTTADDNGGTIKYENGNGGTGGVTNAQIIGKTRYGTAQMLVWESQGIRLGMRSVTNGGSGNIYFTTGNDSVGMQLIGNNLTVTGTITENSSIRYKENIEAIKYGLDKVVQLRGVTYNKKDTGVREIGLIAEEVESILPDLVLKNQEGEPDSVSYGRITAVLIEAIKELKIEIEELKRR
jgi:hypothetical protein